MKIIAGDMGPDNLLKRSSKGDSEGFSVEYTVVGGPYDKRKLFAFHLLSGTTTGHETAIGFTKSHLVAIFDAIHGLDPKDKSPQTEARRLAAQLINFNGATFLATLKIEKDPKGVYRDKNTIAEVISVGDRNYRKLDQPPLQPIERSTPPAQAQASPAPNGAPVVAPTAIAKPSWAQ